MSPLLHDRWEDLLGRVCHRVDRVEPHHERLIVEPEGDLLLPSLYLVSYEVLPLHLCT